MVNGELRFNHIARCPNPLWRESQGSCRASAADLKHTSRLARFISFLFFKKTRQAICFEPRCSFTWQGLFTLGCCNVVLTEYKAYGRISPKVSCYRFWHGNKIELNRLWQCKCQKKTTTHFLNERLRDTWYVFEIFTELSTTTLCPPAGAAVPLTGEVPNSRRWLMSESPNLHGFSVDRLCAGFRPFL